MQPTSLPNSLTPDKISRHDLLEAKTQFEKGLSWYLLKFYIHETRSSLDIELDNVTDIHEQQRIIGRRQALKNVADHFSHYLDNLINEAKDE